MSSENEAVVAKHEASDSQNDVIRDDKPAILPRYYFPEQFQEYYVQSQAGIAVEDPNEAEHRVRPRRTPLEPVKRYVLQVKAPVRLMSVSLALGGFADLFFYQKTPGISVLLYVLLLLGTLFTLATMEKAYFVVRNAWLLLPLLFFATMVFVRANPVLTTLNIIALFVLGSVLVYFYAADHLEQLGVLGYPLVLVSTLASALVQASLLVEANVKLAAKHRGHFKLATSLVRGILIAVPILIVFIYLLSSADTIFAKYLADLTRLDFSLDLIIRPVLIILTALAIAGNFGYAFTRHLGPRPNIAKPENLPGTLILNPVIGFTEVLIVLVLVDLLFAGFAIVQFTYLFSGKALSEMNYITYQAYVQRGFGELLVASMLTILLILGLRWLSRPQNSSQKLVFNLLCTAMAGLAIVMMVSAFQRMVMWENVEFYVNTQLRIYVRSFIIWLGLTFGWLLLTLWWRQIRFPIGLFVALIGFLVTVNIWNPDADVVESNLARYQGTPQEAASTSYYFSSLSDDAIPVLVSSLDTTSGQLQKNIRKHLANRLLQMQSDKSWQNWQSFHFARWQTYDTLTQLWLAGKI